MKARTLGFVFLAVFIFFLQSNAQSDSILSITYKPDFVKGNIKSFLKDISRKTGVFISYSAVYVDVRRMAYISDSSKTLGQVLSDVLEGQDLIIRARGNYIMIFTQPESDKKGNSAFINGYVRDLSSKEVLINATVYIPELRIGSVTNHYGYYSFSAPKGEHKIIYSYLGYLADTLKVIVDGCIRSDIHLKSDNQLLEVKIKSFKESTHDHNHLVYSDIRGTPAIFGENDVMRTLQSTAGVQSGLDGSSTVLVRGGDPSQNLNLLDGAPLFYSDHFLGLTSVYNSEAIKSVDFYKGAFPARYGGRLSSVIDVTSKDGSMEKLGGQFTMGLVKSSVSIEGPIVKEKASFIISGRRTWLDLLWRPFTNDFLVSFYDINAKTNYIVNKNNRIFASFYSGRDQFGTMGENEQSLAKWSNTTASTKWISIITPQLFLNTTVTYSSFMYELKDNNQIVKNGIISNTEGYKGTSAINDIALRVQLNWNLNTKHKLELGGQYANENFNPANVQYLSQKNTSGITNSNKFKSNEIIVFAEDEIQISKKWKVRPGVHFATWFNDRFSYSNLQPRLYTDYLLSSRQNIYASYTQMAQFLHLINNNTYGLPTDFWIPSSSKIEPEESILGTIGYEYRELNNSSYNIEVYYKDIQNVTTYNVGKNLFDNTIKWDDKIIQGIGWSYGAEITARKKINSFRLSCAYTLSWNWRKFMQLNEGRAFPYRFDRRHNFKALISYQPSDKFDATASWTYMSGEAITIPDQIYPDFDNNLLITTNKTSTTSSNDYTYNYTKWNNYRLPSIHRLDICLNFIKRKKKDLERTWSMGIFNVYARKNIMYVELVNADEGVINEYKLRGVSALQFIPHISYKLKF